MICNFAKNSEQRISKEQKQGGVENNQFEQVAIYGEYSANVGRGKIIKNVYLLLDYIRYLLLLLLKLAEIPPSKQYDRKFNKQVWMTTLYNV